MPWSRAWVPPWRKPWRTRQEEAVPQVPGAPTAPRLVDAPPHRPHLRPRLPPGAARAHPDRQEIVPVGFLSCWKRAEWGGSRKWCGQTRNGLYPAKQYRNFQLSDQYYRVQSAGTDSFRARACPAACPWQRREGTASGISGSTADLCAARHKDGVAEYVPYLRRRAWFRNCGGICGDGWQRRRPIPAGKAGAPAHSPGGTEQRQTRRSSPIRQRSVLKGCRQTNFLRTHSVYDGHRPRHRGFHSVGP